MPKFCSRERFDVALTYSVYRHQSLGESETRCQTRCLAPTDIKITSYLKDKVGYFELPPQPANPQLNHLIWISTLIGHGRVPEMPDACLLVRFGGLEFKLPTITLVTEPGKNGDRRLYWQKPLNICLGDTVEVRFDQYCRLPRGLTSVTLFGLMARDIIF